MSIVYEESLRAFALHTGRTTYQMQINAHGHLLHLYYGRRLDNGFAVQTADEEPGVFCPEPGAAGMTCGGSLNVLAQEYSGHGTGDFRTPCLIPVFSDGSASVELKYVSHVIQAGKPPLDGLPALHFQSEQGVDTLEIRLADEAVGLTVILRYTAAEASDVITRSAIIHNTTGQPLFLEAALSCCLDLFSSEYHFIRFMGRPLMERDMVRTQLCSGETTAHSCGGISSHQSNPFVIICSPDATETGGECYGAALLYSGNFIATAQVDMFERTRLTLGINPRGFRYCLEPGESFQTPEAVLAYSDQGLERLSHVYHKAYNAHLCRGMYQQTRKPVLLNSWEAMLYRFDEEKLLDMAKEAADLGIELLVIDDGWFGKRDDDTTSLGDWFVHKQKFPGTLGAFADKLHHLGMKLGLWFEPEMISEDSELYREHPDWCLKIPGREPARCRFQLVLDLSRSEVVEYLTNVLSELITESRLSYVKWDMNRPLTDVLSAGLPAARQGEVAHRYVLGLYRLLDSLTEAFPKVLFESCASGGGRFDPGMLYYTPQIWCSDNSDAVNRLHIQHNTSFGYPISSMGSHVSPCPNHQVGRVTSLKTRSVVASAGTFGYELDVRTLSAGEKQEVREQIAFYRHYYELINQGRYFRLTSPYEDWPVAWQFVSPDGKTSLVSVVQRMVKPNARRFLLKLRGLDPNGSFTVVIDGKQCADVSSGALLMQVGLSLQPVKQDFYGYFVEIREA